MRKVISNIQESFHKIIDGFLSRNLQDKKEWDDILKAWKEKSYQPRILYLAKLSLKLLGKLRLFQINKRCKEFITPGPVLSQMLKVVF